MIARLTRARRPGTVAGLTTAAVLVVTGAASDAVANSQSVAAHVPAQLTHPGLLLSSLLATAGAAGAARLIQDSRP